MACEVHSAILKRFYLRFKFCDWQRCHLLNNLLRSVQLTNFAVVSDLSTELWQSKNDKSLVDFCHHCSGADFVIQREMRLFGDQSCNVRLSMKNDWSNFRLSVECELGNSRCRPHDSIFI